jgi:hypothetical protein
MKENKGCFVILIELTIFIVACYLILKGLQTIIT